MTVRTPKTQQKKKHVNFKLEINLVAAKYVYIICKWDKATDIYIAVNLPHLPLSLLYVKGQALNSILLGILQQRQNDFATLNIEGIFNRRLKTTFVPHFDHQV